MKRASSSQDEKLLQILKEMESSQEEYPEVLLSARRAAFLERVAQSTAADTEEQVSLQDQKLVEHLSALGSVPVKYPPLLLAIRRSAFVYRIAWLNFVSLCAAAWQAIQRQISIPAFSRHIPALRKALPTYVLTASLALAAYVGYLFYEGQATSPQPSKPPNGTVQSGRIVTTDGREVRIICKQGAKPPLCLAGEYKRDNGLTYQGNGLARPAVAKDTIPGAGELHKAAYINDGMYGPGASWISNSKNSWIKIDLGKPTEFNTVTFGRDRLGKLSGHDPGQFVIALAMTDNVYADGNSSDDYREYQLVFNSKNAGFSGKIAGAETVVAQFAPQKARFIKITFENKGTAIDEVEIYNMKQSSVASSLPDKSSRDKDKDEAPPDTSSSQISDPVAPAMMTVTSPPVSTATPTPTVRVIPSNTPTPIPTATDVPTNTAVPTSTAIPTSTSVPPSTPTDVPSDTPLPPPTSTPVPPDTATSEPTEVPIQVEVSPQVDYYDYLTSYPPTP
jgi:hypothetical protein